MISRNDGNAGISVIRRIIKISENKIKYRQRGDYLLPEWKASASPRIGAWGEYRKALYTGMLLSGELNSHLEEIERQAEAMFFRWSSR